jgi:hypothetical protein
MSQKLVRGFLVAIVIMFGSSVAFAQEKAIPKEDRAKVAGIWAEDCANTKGKWADVVAGWMEVYAGGRMETNKEGKRVFVSMGKKVYRGNYASVQSSGPGVLAINTKTKGTIGLKMLPDGKMNVAVKDPGGKYNFEYAGDMMQCK